MSVVKISISIQESLLEQAEQIADEMKISPSRLVSLALEDFVQRYRNRQILEQINEGNSNDPDEGEAIRRQKMRRIQCRLVNGEWM